MTKYGVVFTANNKLLFSFDIMKNNYAIISNILDIAPEDGFLNNNRDKLKRVNISCKEVCIFDNYSDAKLFYEVR